MRASIRITAAAILVANAAVAQTVAQTDQGRGREIIARFVETNRYWLVGPPPEVRQFSYSLNRLGAKQGFAVTNPLKAPRSRRTGVTYFTMLHHLATTPGGVTVRTIAEEGGRIRLTLAFDPPVRGACGNGVENSWSGYFSLPGDAGYLVLDAERLVPLEAVMGELTERFAEFAQVDATHYVPLAITVQDEDMRFDWRFRLYEPGLWLFDDSRYGGRRVAWLVDVKVNEDTPALRREVGASTALEEAEAVGTQALQAFLKANQQWMLPSLQERRGLVYEYRQEPPYTERVVFDSEGNLLARLEASMESPDKPTRQWLWLADGRKVIADYDDRYVKIEAASVPQERMIQHFAMGLALECALTRLAREPDAFWAESLPADNPGQYRLVLHPLKKARLFAGTMLGFTSWAYMHDVDYDRSEILCDATTHQPLRERDFGDKDELRGEFHFENWLSVGDGTAPERIRAVIPFKKKGKAESLEMEARFRVAPPGVWLLDQVQSHFRRDGGGSTGTVSVVSAQADSFAPMVGILAKVKATEQILASVRAAPDGSIEFSPPGEVWQALPFQAAWPADVRTAAGAWKKKAQTLALIGIHRARSEPTPGGGAHLILEGISTASWKAFETEWKASWRDALGRTLTTATTNVVIYAEDAPAAFVVTLAAPPPAAGTPVVLVSLEGTVRRLTAAYHGHGMWMRFAKTEP